MKKKVIPLLSVFSLLTCCSFNFINKQNISLNNSNILEATTVASYTMKEMCDFLNDKNEHYPYSDEFIEKYQQESGGYIAYAKKLGVTVNKGLCEPNQKWHYFTSWVGQCVIEEGESFYEADAKKRSFTYLQCPELLLWIFEASEVSPSKVKNAFDKAIEGKIAGTKTSSIAASMRKCVTWDDIEVNLRSYKASLVNE